MAGIRKRLGSILGPQGISPQITETVTRQVPSGTPASATIVKTGNAQYRAEFAIPAGLDGDPDAVEDFGEAISLQLNTEGSPVREALGSVTVQAASVRRIITSENRNEPLQEGDLLLVYEPIEYPFTDFGNGLAGMTERWRTNHWTAEEDSSALSGTMISTSQIGGARRLLSFDAAQTHDFASPDVEIVTRAKIRELSSAGFGGGVALRASGSQGAENTYLLVVGRSTVNIARIVNGTWSELASHPAPDLDHDAWYWLRFRAIGNELSGKFWVDGQPEPDDWQLSIEDNSFTDAGWVGLFAGSHHQKHSWDRLGVAFNGSEAAKEVSP